MGSTGNAGKRPWADGPFELLSISQLGYQPGDEIKPSHTMAKEMIIAHNFLIRGINSVYLQCVHVERAPDAVPAFVHYASTWSRIVKAHHDSEEQWVFPDIEAVTGAAGLMQGNVEEHRAFEEGVEEYDAYLKSVLGGTEEYQGARLKAVIDSFMPTLRDHLANEIDSLKTLERYEDKTDWAKWTADTLNKVVKKGQTPDGMAVEFPFNVMNHDATYEKVENWPPVPWVILYVIKLLYFGKHSDWWQFAPCDKNSQPKELPFAL